MSRFAAPITAALTGKTRALVRSVGGTRGMHYLMEQALVAMLVAGKQCAVAPASTYVVAPDRRAVEQPTAILQHYTAESKAWYFRFAWRHIMGN